MKCSFEKCNNEVCGEEKESTDQMKFCKEHYDELRRYIEAGDAKKILGFWIKASGGAKKLAETF